MMGLAEIVDSNHRASQVAAMREKRPVILGPLQWLSAQAGILPTIEMPYLGDYVPAGWEMIPDRLVLVRHPDSDHAMSAEAQARLARYLASFPVGTGFAAVDAFANGAWEVRAFRDLGRAELAHELAMATMEGGAL